MQLCVLATIVYSVYVLRKTVPSYRGDAAVTDESNSSRSSISSRYTRHSIAAQEVAVVLSAMLV